MDKLEELPSKPHWDNWHVRLPNPQDQQRAIERFHQSGAASKSDFVRGLLLSTPFKVITTDKSAVEYFRKLSELTAQIHKIGILYNQAVKSINAYHSVKTAQLLLAKLEAYSQRILALLQQALALTTAFREQ